MGEPDYTRCGTIAVLLAQDRERQRQLAFIRERAESWRRIYKAPGGSAPARPMAYGVVCAFERAHARMTADPYLTLREALDPAQERYPWVQSKFEHAIKDYEGFSE